MVTFYEYQTHKVTQYKNLGWLLKHASKVCKIYVQHLNNHPNWEVLVIFETLDGVLLTEWASYSVFRGWLRSRRVLTHVVTVLPLIKENFVLWPSYIDKQCVLELVTKIRDNFKHY